MELSSTHQDSASTVTLRGDFTFADNQRFRQMLSNLEGKSCAMLTVNLTQVSFIDSAALGMLLLLRDHAERHHCKLILQGAQGQVEKMFTLSRFDQLFTLE